MKRSSTRKVFLISECSFEAGKLRIIKNLTPHFFRRDARKAAKGLMESFCKKLPNQKLNIRVRKCNTSVSFSQENSTEIYFIDFPQQLAIGKCPVYVIQETYVTTKVYNL